MLDNLEQVIDAIRPTLSRWLVDNESLTLITTSRIRLRIAGERVMEVPPLSLPAAGATFAEVARSEAVALLVARIRESDPSFRLTAANAPSVAALVTAVDGLPLAIELTAARGQADPEALATDPLGPVQRTLRSTLDWSWNLLDPPAQRVLAECSVFEGGFSLEAAEAVMNPPMGDSLMLDVLQDLVDRSLLQVRRREGGFALLRTVRAYARERLIDLGGDDDLRHRHAQWYARLRSRPGSPPTTVEVDNARAACLWAIEADRVTLAMRTGLVVGDAAASSGPLASEAELLARVLALPGGGIEDRVQVRLRRARLLTRGLQKQAACAEAERALAELEGFHDPALQGEALASAARVSWELWPVEDTLATLDRSIEVLRGVGPTGVLANALAVRANVRWCLRMPLADARADLQEAERVLQVDPDPYLLAALLAVRATILGESLAPVIALAQRSGYVSMALDAQCMAGLAAAIDGALDHAEELLTQALEGAQRCGFLGRQADCSSGLTAVALRRGRFDEAEHHCRRTLALRGEASRGRPPRVVEPDGADRHGARRSIGGGGLVRPDRRSVGADRVARIAADRGSRVPCPGPVGSRARRRRPISPVCCPGAVVDHHLRSPFGLGEAPRTGHRGDRRIGGYGVRSGCTTATIRGMHPGQPRVTIHSPPSKPENA